MSGKFQRRHFIMGATAAAAVTAMPGVSALAKTIKHKGLDPVNPDILFGTTSSIWNDAGLVTSDVYPTEAAIRMVAARGLQGIEFYGHGIEAYIHRTMELKKMFDDAGITFIDASNGEK